MNQTAQYRQLLPEDRMTMASMKQQGSSARAMARALDRSPSTITRELARNTLTAMPYGSHTAQVASFTRRVAARPAARLAFDSVGWGVVRTMLDWKWSPQQITATLKRVFPDNPDRHVSHETIYTAIYAQPRGELRKQLLACLRHGRSTRMPRSRGDDRRGQIPDMVSIHVRPPEVDDRVMPGHWEGDFIKGAGNKSSVGVLVERTSRLVLRAKMDDAAAVSALAGFSAKLNSIAAPLRKSFTYDQGKEMSRHVERDPTFEDGWWQRATAHFIQHRAAEALADADHYLALHDRTLPAARTRRDALHPNDSVGASMLAVEVGEREHRRTAVLELAVRAAAHLKEAPRAIKYLRLLQALHPGPEDVAQRLKLLGA